MPLRAISSSSPPFPRNRSSPPLLMDPCYTLALNHISYLCRSVENTSKFYKTVLGFQEVDRPAFEFEGSWCVHPLECMYMLLC